MSRSQRFWWNQLGIVLLVACSVCSLWWVWGTWKMALKGFGLIALVVVNRHWTGVKKHSDERDRQIENLSLRAGLSGFYLLAVAAVIVPTFYFPEEAVLNLPLPLLPVLAMSGALWLMFVQSVAALWLHYRGMV